MLQISSDPTTTSAKIKHKTCVAECPNLCSNKWSFHNGKEWEVDTRIAFSCVRKKSCCKNIRLVSTADPLNNSSNFDRSCGSISFGNDQHDVLGLGEYRKWTAPLRTFLFDGYLNRQCKKFLFHFQGGWTVSMVSSK